MKTNYQKKTIRLSQIVNREMARHRVLFKSSGEASDPECWKQFLSNCAGNTKYQIIVRDDTPDEMSEKSKRYSILYGLKRLYAAEQLNLEEISVKVLPASEPIDIKVSTCFFNADFASMSSYEKGEFLEELETKLALSFDNIARNSGFPFNTLNSIRSAYHDSQRNLYLRNAYKQGLIPMNIVIRMRKYYEITPFSDHRKLTEFVIENKDAAVELISRAVKTREKDITAPMAIRHEIFQKKEPVPETGPFPLEALCMRALIDDGLLSSECEMMCDVRKVIEDKKLSVMMKTYLTVRKKCRKAYDDLCSVLPQDLILEYGKALQLPDKTESSYAFPRKIKKYEKVSENKTERRLLVRILEYTETALDETSFPLQFRTAVNLFNNIRIQNSFAVYFRYSIRYRNLKKKMDELFIRTNYLNGMTKNLK